MDITGDFQYMSPTDYSKGQVPWSLQPEELPAIIDTEQERLRECRRGWLQLVDTRISSYDFNGIKQSTQSSPLAKSLSTSSNSSASNHVFNTTELLERILRQADSSAHLVALGVCHMWRDVALYIMKPSDAKYDFACPYPCSPVKFGDRVPRHLNWLLATAEELEWVASEVFLEVGLGAKRGNVFRSVARFEAPDEPNVIETVCHPSRITMAPNATSRAIFGAKSAYCIQLDFNDIRPPFWYHVNHVHLPKWADITQFRLNPNFSDLFQHSLEVINGLCEISLQPSCPTNSGLAWDALPPAAMSYLATQLATQPPVISLNVSTWIPMMKKPRVRKALHIVNVRNVDGIRVPELLAAMTAASGFAIEHRKYWARLLRGAVNSCDPRQDFWTVDGRPKLLISLDPAISGESKVRALFYDTCMYALPGNNKRRGEWVPRKVWYSITEEEIWGPNYEARHPIDYDKYPTKRVDE